MKRLAQITIVGSVALLSVILVQCGNSSSCIGHVLTYCTDGILYWADGCGNVEDQKETCSCGCKADHSDCKDCVCQPSCTGRCCGVDGCGKPCTDSCSATGQTCNSNTCLCEGTCQALNCTQLGKECGTWDDGCGKSLQCPTCSSGKTCSADGHCVSSCPSGETLCGTTCVATASDHENCGSCGHACGSSQVCTNGNCQDSPDCRTTPCPQGYYCNLGTGACLPGCIIDTQCGTNEACDISTHGCICQVGYHRCSGACVSDNSPASCGSRCSACPGDPNGTATCDGTSCGLQCKTGFSACGSLCCPRPGSVCLSNACVPGCAADGECSAGEICENNKCRVGCRKDGDCAATEYCNTQTLTCKEGCRTNVDCATPGTWCDWSQAHICAACVDQSYEPNETESGATSLEAPLGTTTTWTLSICGQGDVDYLRITVNLNEGSRYQMTIEDLTTFSSSLQVDWTEDYLHTVYAYNGDGPVVVQDVTVESCYSPCPDTYVYKVTGSGSAKPLDYRITVQSWY